VAESCSLPVAELATLPRRELTADFHRVAGWSATSLHWKGVALETFYRMIIEPSVQPDASLTHLAFGGLDGYRSVVTIEDALGEDVLIAERLDARPLVRPIYRLVTVTIRFLSARGSSGDRGTQHDAGA
jgi:DMSO/TMAO reductase YedYZ molybdopterin-dependent catalytic subunit